MGLTPKRLLWLTVFAIHAGCLSGLSGERECETTCLSLATCGFLPSLLGARGSDVSAEQNCIERCERTEDSGRDPIWECSRDAAVESSDWCTSASACSELDACLRGKFPSVPITGLGTLQVEAWRECANGSELSLTGECPRDGSAALRCPWSDEAAEQCESNGLTLRAFVALAEGRRFGPARACAEGLTQHTSFDDLPPRRLKVGIQVLGGPEERVVPEADGGDGTADGGTAGAATTVEVVSVRDCREFTNDVVLEAGAEGALAAVVVSLSRDEGVTCEVCDDRADNDGDFLVDCDDGDCTLECDKVSPLSGEGGNSNQETL